MDLRHLRAFVMVGKELHFRRSAEKLRLAQPALSATIHALENDLGVELLKRSRRTVTLTEPGRLFLAEAESILNSVGQAVTLARRAAIGEVGSLTVGFTASTAFEPLVSSTLRAFRERYRDVILTLVERNTNALVSALNDGSIDVAFLRPPVTHGDRLSIEDISEEAMYLALPAGHRLAALQQVPLTEIDGETLLIRPRPVGPGLADAILTACSSSGASPIVQNPDAPQMTSILNLVAAGMGVAFVPASMVTIRTDAITYRPVLSNPALTATTAVAALAHETKPTTAQFLALLKRR